MNNKIWFKYTVFVKKFVSMATFPFYWLHNETSTASSKKTKSITVHYDRQTDKRITPICVSHTFWLALYLHLLKKKTKLYFIISVISYLISKFVYYCTVELRLKRNKTKHSNRSITVVKTFEATV